MEETEWVYVTTYHGMNSMLVKTAYWQKQCGMMDTQKSTKQAKPIDKEKK